MEKVKLKDIAKEAGVSVATVSYVLNNNTNQKINEKTRKKILQISSLFGYTKNSFANALATGKSNHIGVYLVNYNFSLQNSENLLFLNKIVEALKINGYSTVLLPNTFTKSVDNVDAILCISLSEDDFKTICSNSMIPVLGIDTKVHEPWIFEICNSYSDIKEKFSIDDYVFMTYENFSTSIMEEIKSANPNTLFISSFSQLNNLKDSLKGKTIVVAGDELFDYVKVFNTQVIHYQINYAKKINKILECLKLAIDHTDVQEHIYKL